MCNAHGSTLIEKPKRGTDKSLLVPWSLDDLSLRKEIIMQVAYIEFCAWTDMLTCSVSLDFDEDGDDDDRSVGCTRHDGTADVD